MTQHTYQMAKKDEKKAVSQVQQQKRKHFGEKLYTEERQIYLFRIAKQLARERQDVVRVKCLRDKRGSIVLRPEIIR